MSSAYGVNITTSVNASRPIAIDGSTPIFLTGTAVVPEGLKSKVSEHNGIIFYGNAEKALEDWGDTTGTIRGSLIGINDQLVKSPVVVSVVSITADQAKKEAEVFYNDTKVKSSIKEAIAKAPNAMAIFSSKAKLLIAPRFSHDKDIRAELQTQATKLGGVGIVDLNAKDEADAMAKIKDGFGTKRLLACDPYVKVWDTKLNKEVTEPMSARVAGLIAYTDSLVEYGWADSASNRVIQGISGTARPIEFVAGQECEADRLRKAGIASVINYKGYRLWGFETTDPDSIWQSLERVRVFDRIGEALLDGVFWAIDKRADILVHAKDSVEGLLRALKGSNVLVGYDVFWHPEKNTKENLTAGKFYLVAEMQNMPTVRRLEIECSFVDKYSGVLMKIIGA